ncbi:MAG: hypothetical protein ACYCPT_06960 [Acidimicrobiales bacterium]
MGPFESAPRSWPHRVGLVESVAWCWNIGVGLLGSETYGSVAGVGGGVTGEVAR